MALDHLLDFFLLIGFYVLVPFLSVLVIPTCGRLSQLVNFCANEKIVID